MFPSVDTLSIIQTYGKIPPREQLIDLGWKERISGKLKKSSWINNGMKQISEPRLTIYQTWHNLFRLRANLEIPKLLFGENITLPDADEIDQSFEIITNNISQRAALPFDARLANVARIDYAINVNLDSDKIPRFFSHYRNFDAPRLLRSTEGNTTVYFANNSRKIAIYDKLMQIISKHKSDIELQKKAKNLIRIEYRILNEKSVKAFAKRQNFADATAGTMLSPENRTTAISEMKDLLCLDSLIVTNEDMSHPIFGKLGDIKKEIRLAGFNEAEKYFGKDFYKIDSLDYSLSTYKRNVEECQNLGLINY